MHCKYLSFRICIFPWTKGGGTWEENFLLAGRAISARPILALGSKNPRFTKCVS